MGIITVLTVFSAEYIPAEAQINDYRDIYWLFGQSKYGITFRKSDFTAQLDSIQNPAFGIGGSAVATDPLSGDLLFYSDGNVVYDQSHQLISNYTAGLNGNTSANQPAVVTALPGQSKMYLVIANSASSGSGGSIFSAQINMNSQGNAPSPLIPGYGQMLPPVNTNLTTNASEAMIVLSNQSGTQTWLITHERNTASFLVTPISSTGVDVANRTTYNFTSDGMPAIIAASFSYSKSTGKLSVAPQDTSKNVQILDFSNLTGALTYDAPVLNSATSDVDNNPSDRYSIYDTEWSPDGSKLYISRHGSNGVDGMVYQYDINNPSVSLAAVLPGQVFRSYGLKIGPDNIIYHLYQETSGGPLKVGGILNSDSAATQVLYVPDILSNINFNGRQFPATLPYQVPDYTNFGIRRIYGNCYGTSTKYYPDILPQADSYLWDFGDGNQSDFIAPIHNYDQSGIYPVMLRASLNGKDTVFVTQIQILDSDTLVFRSETGSELPTDTTICQDETLLIDASQPPAQSITWSDPAATGTTYTVDTAGYYWAVADYGTCQSYDAINVNEYNYQLQVSNQWYFGFEAGIDFNQQPPVALTDGVMNAPEGCTAVSDRNGNILFYTDGETVYGRTGQLIGEFIGGDQTATQSVIAIPFPQDETMYYIFTTREVYNNDGSYVLSYSILDIKQTTNGDPGKIIEKNIPLYEKNTERITAIGGYGNNAVLVAHELGNNTFRLYPITQDGIDNPVLQSIGSIHSFGSEESSEGYMKFSQDGSKLAVALSQGGHNYVDLFDYTDTTMTLSNHMLIEFNELYPEYQVYGVEFSPGTNKLYVSLSGNTSRIYEIRLDSADVDFMNQTKNMLREESRRIGALQMGPDGRIYVAIDGSGTLSTISPNDDPLTPSVYNPDNFDLAGKISGLGLPNFIQNTGSGIGAPSAAVTGFCVGQETTFTGQVSSDIDNVEWMVTRPSDSTRLFTDTQPTTTYTFQQAGDYIVSYRVANRCGLDTTIVQTITIKDSPPDPTIPESFAICSGNELLEAAPAGSTGFTYLWNDGSTGRTIQVTDPGIYSVVISYTDTTLNGCTSTAESFVADGRPQFDLGPDVTVCQDDNVADLATGLNPTSYIFDWRINGTQSGVSNGSHPIDSSNPGNYSYTVYVEDNLTNCFNRDTAEITINPSPTATYTINNSTCGNNDGSVQINGQTGNSTITLYDQNGSQAGLNNLTSGTYSLVIQNQISGCSHAYNVNVADAGANLAINVNPVEACDFGSLEVQVGGATFPIDYTLTNTLNGTITSGQETDSSFVINSLDTGNYDLQITTAGSCTDFQQGIVLSRPPSAAIDVQPQYINCQTNITVDPDPNNLYPGQDYYWNGPGIQSDLQTRQLSVSSQGTFTVRAEQAGLCPTEESFEIILYEIPQVNIDVSGNGCGDAVQLIATIENRLPGTNYSYLWSYNNAVGDRITLPAPASGDSTSYNNISVDVVNQQNGCRGSDGPINVSTYQDYSVFLTSSIACENGNPVTLTANILNISSNNIDSFSWSGPQPGLNNMNSQSIDVQEEGSYQVITSWNNCERSASINVDRSPVTETNLQPFYAICPEPPANESVILEVGDFVSYTLFNETINQLVAEIEPGKYEIFEEGLYQGSGINSYGCVTVDSFGVQARCLPQVYAPNAFYPNSSIPKNQTFSIDGAYIAEDFQIIIFDRWGEPVYESKDKNFRWNGTRNGVPLPGGTYAYVIRFKSITEDDPRIYEQRGGITLIR